MKKLDFRRWMPQRRAWIGLGSLLLLALAVWAIHPFVPPEPPLVQPDSPEAWRAMVRSGNRPAALAATLLLAATEDAEATRALLERFPSLEPPEFQTVLEVFLYAADRDRVDPALIDALLDVANDPAHRSVEKLKPGFEIWHGVGLTEVAQLIPRGQESRHKDALLRAAKRVMAQNHFGLNVGAGPTAWQALDTLVATGDAESLSYCDSLFRQAMARGRRPSQPYLAAWARVVLGQHRDDPSAGHAKMERDYPDLYSGGFKEAYSRELVIAKRDIRATVSPAPRLTRASHACAHSADSPLPWAIRRHFTSKALGDLRELEGAIEKRVVDLSALPADLCQLTTPIAFMPNALPDVCAAYGSYGYATWQWASYAIASPGPDGVRNISLLHLMLTRQLEGKRQNASGETYFVRWTPDGYEYLEGPAPGADIILVHQ